MNRYKIISMLVVFILNIEHAFSQSVELKLQASGFIKPVDISSTGETGDDRLFIVEKDGLIRILKKDGSVLSLPFIAIDAKVNSQANERGLLGLCFHPDYTDNGYFFVNYTNNNGNTTISRFTRSLSNHDIADPTSEKIILVVNQPFNNHNGGDLNFGPDGFLYIGMGDGGSGGDPGNRSQNPKELLGKMLRLDINTETEKYLIPSDNPYKNSPDTLKEIWSMGLRNPWRFSFDDIRNDIWIGDVGQDKWEEINVARSDMAGLNYGWRCFEGFEDFNKNGCREESFYHAPVYAYENKFDVGCSITGGYVYRGLQNTSLYGKYIYTDFCTGIFWTIYRDIAGLWKNEILIDADNMDFVSFGEDNEKELYVAGLASGNIYKLTEKTSLVSDSKIENEMFYLRSNIVNDILTVRCTETLPQPVNWSIVNSAGIIMKFGNEQNVYSEFNIDVSDLTPGLYMINNTSGVHQVSKFIKI